MFFSFTHTHISSTNVTFILAIIVRYLFYIILSVLLYGREELAACQVKRRRQIEIVWGKFAQDYIETYEKETRDQWKLYVRKLHKLYSFTRYR